jgi:hypothetical protein
LKDSQVIELLGRNRLVDELLRAGLEVALPLRDRGIDLIAYADSGEGVPAFVGRPIQMKAASGQSFSIDRKYTAFPNLILAYVWSVNDPANTVTYALTYAEALAVADAMGYTKTQSWQRGLYSCTSISARLLQLLEPHRMNSDRWCSIVTGAQP